VPHAGRLNRSGSCSANRSRSAKELESENSPRSRANRDRLQHVAALDRALELAVQRPLRCHGHQSITVTIDRYGHWERAARKREARLMEGVFGV
jgi:hypothetical protein